MSIINFTIQFKKNPQLSVYMSCCTSQTIRKLHHMEDSVMKMPGLYTFWTVLYAVVLAVLSADNTVGSSRDFLMIMAGVSTLFPAFSGMNMVYGNGLPSTMFLAMGPIYQYLYWQLLAYYRADVYGTHPIGVTNAVFTGITGLFTVDMVVKTWAATLNSRGYKTYAEEKVKQLEDAQ